MNSRYCNLHVKKKLRIPWIRNGRIFNRFSSIESGKKKREKWKNVLYPREGSMVNASLTLTRSLDACIQQWWNNEFSWQCRKRVDKSDTNDLSARVMHSDEPVMAKWGQEWRSVNRRIWNLSMFAICLVKKITKSFLRVHVNTERIPCKNYFRRPDEKPATFIHELLSCNEIFKSYTRYERITEYAYRYSTLIYIRNSVLTPSVPPPPSR